MEYNHVLITIATVNLQKLVYFYMQVLGQEPVKMIPNIYAEFQILNLTLGIFKPKTIDESEFAMNSKSPVSLCIEVTNLEKAIAQLKNIGYPVEGKISIASHGREIYAYDPDGNRLILHQGY
jgi:predicted enzyme related to lactoylglutathione lyase